MNKKNVRLLGLSGLLLVAPAMAQDEMAAPVPIPAEQAAPVPKAAPAAAEPAPPEAAPAEAAAPAPAETAEPAAAPEALAASPAPAEPAPVEAAPVAEAPVAVAEAEAVAVEAEVVAETEAAGSGFHYLGALGTYSLPDEGRDNNNSDIDSATGFGVLYGYQRADRWGFEVQAFSETFETSDVLGTDWYRYGLNLDLTYAFGDRTSLTPFLLAGVGGNQDDVFPQDDEFTWFANVGAGLVTGPIAAVGDLRLRAEARYVYDNFEAGYGDVRLGLGVEIPLFGKRGAVPPAPVQEVVRIVEVATGLKDSDADGVVDEKDQCPETPAGSRVDGYGCPLGKVTTLHGVTFEFDQARLRPDAKTILGDTAALLKRYPDIKVEIAGHTDSTGSQEYNQQLSEVRAAAVREHLVSQGLPSEAVSSKGYGELEPVADNATAEGRELNRRVEMRILN